MLLFINHSSYADQKESVLFVSVFKIISRHKPAFLRPKVNPPSPRTRLHKHSSSHLDMATVPIHTLPMHSKLSVPRRRNRRTRTASPGTNLRRRAERRPLSTLSPTDYTRRPRTETRAAGSPASGNVGGAFVAAGVTPVAECAGGCESRRGGEA